MKFPRAHPPLLVALSLMFAQATWAQEVVHAPVLQELPSEKLAGLAAILQHGDLSLIESLPDGKMKQVTIVTLVAAPPEVVREVVATPERYGDLLAIEKLKVEHGADGWVHYSYGIDLKITSIDTYEQLQPLSDGGVEVKADHVHDHSHFLWRFIGVPGGTVVVQYGYTDILHSGPFVRRLVRGAPTLEHGLALGVQLGLVRSIKFGAEKRAKAASLPPFAPVGAPTGAAAHAPGFKFLLERGRVAVIRSRPDGHLSDISIIDNIYAPREKIVDVLLHPNAFPKIIDGVKKAYEIKRDADGLTYESEFDLTIFSWTSRFAARSDGKSVDTFGLSGDLRGARYRWDLTATNPNETQVVYRANQDLAAASPLILGLVFRKEPLAEHGLSVALALMNVVGVRGRAEGWK